jgi:uncharacterized protein YndB with AHSA1/START domain
MTTDKIEQQVIINAPIERVWEVLTSAEGVKAWYAFGGAEIDLRPGGKLAFRWDEHGKYSGEVEAVEENHRFSFRFAPFEENAKPTKGNSTLVDIVLKPEKSGSIAVHLTESGYTSLDMSDSEKAENYATSKGAWADALGLLKSTAEKQ